MLRKTVMIEPSLRLQSPENGSFRGGDRRLSATSTLSLLNRERGDRPLDRKSPLIVGLSGLCGGSLSATGTGWLE